MKRDWLGTEIGINVVAIGLVAIMFCLIIFTIQDISILLTGKLLTFTTLTSLFYMFLAVLAAVFSAFTVFIWRGVVPRILIGLFSVSMLSHIIEHSLVFPVSLMRAVAICRIAVTLGLLLLSFQYSRSTKGAASSR